MEMLKEMFSLPEKPNYLVMLAGGGLAAGISWGTEHWFEVSPETWPFPGWPVWTPPLDQWIPAGVSFVSLLAGHYTKNDTLKQLGQGGLIFAIPNLLRIALIRNVTWVVKSATLGEVTAQTRMNKSQTTKSSPAVGRYVVTA